MNPSSIHPFWRLLLLAAAADAVLAGGWAALRPGDVLAWLALPPTDDRLLAARAVGALVLSQAGFLSVAAARPLAWGGLALVALAGRTLLAGVWLWLLGSGKAGEPAAAAWLLVHDAVWAPALAAFMWSRGRRRRDLSSSLG